jgi:8-oxo-dGTP pyrophosphatase MutT (NUDIX family)
MSTHQIRPLVICVFHHQGRILVNEAVDALTSKRYCRPLGGGIEFGEASASALEREIREELGEQVEQLRFIGTLENILTCDGVPGHELVLVYDGVLSNRELYSRPYLPGRESDGTPFRGSPLNMLERLDSRCKYMNRQASSIRCARKGAVERDIERSDRAVCGTQSGVGDGTTNAGACAGGAVD